MNFINKDSLSSGIFDLIRFVAALSVVFGHAVIPPFFEGFKNRAQATAANFCCGVMQYHDSSAIRKKSRHSVSRNIFSLSLQWIRISLCVRLMLFLSLFAEYFCSFCLRIFFQQKNKMGSRVTKCQLSLTIQIKHY